MVFLSRYDIKFGSWTLQICTSFIVGIYTARYSSVSASFIFGLSYDITLIRTKSKTFSMNTVETMSVNCLRICQ